MQISEPGNFARWSIAAHHSINPSAVATRSIPWPKFVLAVFRQKLRMFDHVAIHVDDPQRPVGPRSGHHRATPAVFAGKEVSLRFGWIATKSKAHAFVNDQVVLDQIVKRFAGEGMLIHSTIEHHLISINHG